jgi:hypothetical protein
MPVNSRDVQFGAAIGFIVIVGIVAIYFGFSTKLILALLAGLGILFCASLVEGYVRAAMLGTGALLLVLIAYDLATSCDSTCQQTRAEAAQQRAALEQARLAAEQSRLAALRPQTDPLCNWETKTVTVGADWVELHGDRCSFDLNFPKQDIELYVKTVLDDTPRGQYHWGQQLPDGVVAVMNKGTPFKAQLQLVPPRNRPALPQ